MKSSVSSGSQGDWGDSQEVTQSGQNNWSNKQLTAFIKKGMGKGGLNIAKVDFKKTSKGDKRRNGTEERWGM